MDDIVKQALAKWPNVPHCYGWLALDARGAWRMRDEQAQTLQLPGERIHNIGLQQFISRNYVRDERGCWYFQNGPQRVYVTLEATPYIARTDPAHRFTLHTGEALGKLDAIWITDEGTLILQSDGKVAQVDDRDLASCLAMLRLNGAVPTDEALLDYLNGVDKNNADLTIQLSDGALTVQKIHTKDLPAAFGFVRRPQPMPT